MPDNIELPRDLAIVILDLLEAATDEGPQGEGWKSDELKAAIESLRDAIALRENFSTEILADSQSRVP